MPRSLRLIVGLALTAIALWLAHPREFLRIVAGADWRWIAAAIALVAVDRGLMAYRWLVLLRTIDPASRPPLATVLRVFFVSTFLGTFLPSAGGDVVRAYGLSRHGVRGVEAGASVVMDRFLGALSILMVAAVSLSFADARTRSATLAPTVAATAACALGIVLMISETAEKLLRRVLDSFPWERFRRKGGELLTALRGYVHHRGVLLNVTAGSLAVQVLRVLQAYCLGRALHIPVSVASLPAYFEIIPLVLLVTLIPVTVNGLGTSQIACIWLFGAIGVAEAPAFSFSVLFVALGAVGNLPGGIIYALESGDVHQSTT